MNPHQKKAIEIACRVMRALKIKAGQTEKEVALFIKEELRRFGAKPAFRVIVGSGLRSLDPHVRPKHKRIKSGEQVVVDLGACYKGYYSDITRTFLIGKGSKRQEQVYRLLKAAQNKAIGAVRAGVTGREIDLAARQHIQKNCALLCRLAGSRCAGDCFVHTTGHGIGRKMHQQPRIALKNHQRLKKGSVITIEPGIYVKGWGGMRIEDMVLVTESGCRMLTR